MKIKKGYTLLELMITISIISILSIMFSRYFITYEKYRNRILVDQCNNTIMSFINSCKQYCYYKDIGGYIKFDVIGNRLIFYVGTEVKRILNTTRGLKLYSINVSNGDAKLNFDNKGFTSDACTMSFEDSDTKIHEITISVGTSYVEIKN
jgi:prepilin-type N-terminal cleavage/methylation domain-containing protein